VDANNYRTEMLAFEGVDFSKLYHVILGWPCYVKFMAIPSYAYLKLMILGPIDVITVQAKAQWALDYEQSNMELATVAIIAADLKEFCLSAPPSSTNPAMPSMSSSFKAIEDAKAVQINVEDPAKTIQIRAGLSPK
jgi:hypothetical protein